MALSCSRLAAFPCLAAFPRPARRSALAVAAVLAVGIGLTACSSGGDTSTATTTPTTAGPASTTPTGTPTTGTGTGAPSTTAAERATVIVSYAGGTVDSPSEVEVKLGETVVISATSDVPEEIHVHTYDKHLGLEPGVPARLSFTADIPGVHEVELEKAHKQLFRLRVQ
jgi:hypothetical protein